MIEHVLVMLAARSRAARRAAGRAPAGAVAQPFDDLAHEPGPPIAAAPDHQRRRRPIPAAPGRRRRGW